jgi:hypothetical protein
MELRARAAILSVVFVGGALGCGKAQTGAGRTTSGSTVAPTTSATPPVTVAPPPVTTRTSKAPTVAALSTSTALLDGGTPLTITGTSFAAAGETLVVFGLRAVSVRPSSDTRIDLVVPAGVQVGPADVRVVNANGAGLLSGAFSYVGRAASFAFEPSVGHYELGLEGTKVTLALRDFGVVSSAALVTFGGKAAASVSALDATTLVAEVPDGLTPGTVTIAVEENGARASAGGFLVQGALSYGDLTINELCSHPSGLDTNRDGGRSTSADEFVEIVNTTAQPVDLSFLTLYDSTATERHRFPNPTTLPPGGAIVVFGGGSLDGFGKRHESGFAQGATSGELAQNNTSDTMEIRTLPGTASRGTTIFVFNYTNPPVATSFVNPNDGKAIRSNPATNADYVPHATAPGARGPVSPGWRMDGSKF